MAPGAKAEPPLAEARAVAAGPERGARRALSHVGGPAEAEGGTPSERSVLLGALAVEPDEEASQRHVHGFHVYPARLHPQTASRLVIGFSREGERVLDPFVGSGTVAVEARWLGRRALGSDLSPLGVALARLKARGADQPYVTSLLAAAERVFAVAEERRGRRVGASRRFPQPDVDAFEPHVLLELDGLRVGLEALPESEPKSALWLVLSAILVKVSRRRADTRPELVPRRLAAGYTSKLFLRKARELGARMLEYGSMVPAGVPPARIVVDDACQLREVKAGSIALVVTSPPYPGVYDYVDHHELSLRWLGLDTRRFERGEVGARRRARELPAREALARWEHELGAWLSAVARVLSPGGRAVLVMADSAVAGRVLRVERMVAAHAPAAGLRPLARAWQARPWFHGATGDAFRHEPRREHLLLLGR